MSTEIVADILKFLAIAKELRPQAEEVTKLVSDYGEMLGKLWDSLSDHMIERRIKALDKYVKGGFTKEQAFQLILRADADFRKYVDNMNLNLRKMKGE